MHLLAKKTKTTVDVCVLGTELHHSPSFYLVLKYFFHSTAFYSHLLLQIKKGKHLNRLLNVTTDTMLDNFSHLR